MQNAPNLKSELVKERGNVWVIKIKKKKLLRKWVKERVKSYNPFIKSEIYELSQKEAEYFFLFSKFMSSVEIIVYIYSIPFPPARYDTKSIFKQSLTGLNSEISFFETGCYTKIKESSQCYCLPIVGERIDECIPCWRVLALHEMQTALAKIWTQIAIFIAYNNNHYSMSRNYCTSKTIQHLV